MQTLDENLVVDYVDQLRRCLASRQQRVSHRLSSAARRSDGIHVSVMTSMSSRKSLMTLWISAALCQAKGGRLCHGTLAQWPVQACVKH